MTPETVFLLLSSTDMGGNLNLQTLVHSRIIPLEILRVDCSRAFVPERILEVWTQHFDLFLFLSNSAMDLSFQVYGRLVESISHSLIL
jgi:hypothetical protein